MIALLLTLPLLLLSPPAGPADPPADGPYARALEGLHALHEENRALRAQLAQQNEPPPQVTVRAGDVVHVRADEFGPMPDEPHLADWRWSFGEPDADYNDLGGFNAAHLYASPGEYAITLNGKPVRRVLVEADTRPVRRVADDRELAAAAGQGGLVVRLPPGTVAIHQTISVAPGTAIVGDPAGTTLLWASGAGGLIFQAERGGATFRDIVFDSAFAEGYGKNAADAIQAGGGDVAVIGCTFLNVGSGINGNHRPSRVLMQGCSAPSPTGLRSYLAWVEGEQWVFLGNSAVNSTREHIIRCAASGPGRPGVRFVLVAYNDFSNLDRRAAAEDPDESDIAKSCLIFQVGEYGWAEHNLFRGIAGVGPLGRADGLNEPERRFRHAVFRDNRHLDTLHVDHGAEHVLIADCRFELPRTGGDGASSVQIEGFDARFDRGVTDVTLRDCLLISPYRNAVQLWVQGPVAKRLALVENTFISGGESFQWGGMPIVIEGGWQEGVYTSSANELPPPAGGWPDKRAFARIGDQNDEGAYLGFEGWLALPGATRDRASDVQVP